MDDINAVPQTSEPSTSSYLQPIAVIATLAIGGVVARIAFQFFREKITEKISSLIATAGSLTARLALKLHPTKPFLPTVGVIAGATLFREAVAENIHWLLSYPAHWMATAVTLTGRGLLTWELGVGTKNIVIGMKDLLSARPTGDALTTEKTRIQTLAQRMQDCAKVIGTLSTIWLAFGLCGFEDTGDLSPLLVPMSATTLGLTGALIASLNGVCGWLLAKSVHSALILPTKTADDTLMTLVPKVLTSARTNHHIPAIGNPDTAQLRRATISYLLVTLGATDTRDILGNFNVEVAAFQEARAATPTDTNARNQALQNFIQGNPTGVPTQWTALATALNDNMLLTACIDYAAR